MAATARPSTHQSSRSHQQRGHSRGKDPAILTDDDFLFVPPSTAGGASARSPRSTRRYPVPVVHRTIVGVGTCGVGANKASPRNVHKEWLQEKRQAAKESGADDTSAGAPPLPPLGGHAPHTREEKAKWAQWEQQRVQAARDAFKAARDEEKRRKKAAAEAREEAIENKALACKEEKKRRRDEAKAVKEESNKFTAEYVQAMLEQRERDKRRAREWNAEMCLIGTMSPERQRTHRRRGTSAHSATSSEAGGDASGADDAGDLSPQQHKQRLMRQLRDEMRQEQKAWQEMTASQRRVTREVVDEKHRRVQGLHDSAREALDSARSQRRAAAEEQRKAQDAYRRKWGAEAEVWRSGRGQNVLDARAERKRRLEAYQTHKEEANMADLQERTAEKTRQKNLLEERKNAVVARNRATAEAVRASLHSSEARKELESRNHRLRDETLLESQRLREQRQADIEAEREQRRELHEDIVRSRSTSPRNNRVTPQHTPRPPPPRAA